MCSSSHRITRQEGAGQDTSSCVHFACLLSLNVQDCPHRKNFGDYRQFFAHVLLMFTLKCNRLCLCEWWLLLVKGEVRSNMKFKMTMALPLHGMRLYWVGCVASGMASLRSQTLHSPAFPTGFIDCKPQTFCGGQGSCPSRRKFCTFKKLNASI